MSNVGIYCSYWTGGIDMYSIANIHTSIALEKWKGYWSYVHTDVQYELHMKYMVSDILTCCIILQSNY